MQNRLTLALAASLALLTGCGESASDNAARDLGYAIAPAGGAPFTGTYHLGDQTWSFSLIVPEGWYWRRREADGGGLGDADGVIAMAPGTDAANLERGPASGYGPSCGAAISFKSMREVSRENDTQETINERMRTTAITAPSSDGRRTREAELLQTGPYVGLLRRTALRRDGDGDTEVIDVRIDTTWETVDIQADLTCGTTLDVDDSWRDDADVATMTALARSAVLIPPPKP